MCLFSFVKGVGEKLTGKKDAPAPAAAPTQAAPSAEPTAQEIANLLLNRVQSLGLGISGLSVSYNSTTDTATIRGEAQSQADREKAVLSVGNIDHVAAVQDDMTVATPEPESKMYTVKSGDTLSKVAKEFYGNANEYNKIFEANKPMLSHPDKIYVGQVLRIPA
ncbi:MAG: peptidoglycan-binding protein LysM [Pseudomonadota bacterium]|nr:peptidoglycan-binding protein LysM [Pseudomonadota bacterium]